MSSPFPCSPVICECSWNKIQIEKKNASLTNNLFLACYFVWSWNDLVTYFLFKIKWYWRLAASSSPPPRLPFDIIYYNTFTIYYIYRRPDIYDRLVKSQVFPVRFGNDFFQGNLSSCEVCRFTWRHIYF